MMQSINTKNEIRSRVSDWRKQGLTVALVPTMGALHEGHLSLVELAKAKADKVIVSIFINPTQFGPNEDFDSYPRTEREDIAKLEMAKVDAVYIPTAHEVYAKDASTQIQVTGLTEMLCGAKRSGHFDGVALVVCKLLLQVLPDIAVFGEKDFQQLAVIKRMVRDLDIPAEILGAPIMREEDGLAMSSRNRYLSADQRESAAMLHQSLLQAAVAIKSSHSVADVLKKAKQSLCQAGFAKIDYIEYRANDDLCLLEDYQPNGRLFGAAFLGKTRLIDNIAV